MQVNMPLGKRALVRVRVRARARVRLGVGYNFPYTPTPTLTPTPNPNANANPTPNRNPNPKQTYERREIFRWLLDHDTSPLSGARLPNKALTPAIALRQLIAAFVAENPSVET